jgi:hypothetical protein
MSTGTGEVFDRRRLPDDGKMPMISTRSGRTAARLLGGVTAGIGAALLLRPHAVASRTSGGRGTPASELVRILGGRQFLQGAAQIIRPGRTVLLGGVALDTLHAASMVAVSLWWPLYRRSALSSAAVAGVCAAAATAILIADPARP